MRAGTEVHPPHVVATTSTARPRSGLGKALRPGRLLLYATVLVGAVVFALPFFWMVSTSFKPENEVFAYPPKWIPTTVTVEGYTEPWRKLDFLTYYRNSVTITGINIVAYLASCSLVAFAFARMRFRGRQVLFLIVLSTMMLPDQVTLIPLFRFWSELGLVNSIGPLTIPAFVAGDFTGAFTIFLLRQYMMTIPLDLDDAAKLDGAGWFRIYWNIILPLSGPGLGAAAIFLFTGKWNDFLHPLIYLQTQDHFTVPLGLAQLNSRFSLQYQQTMAQTLISLVPVLLVFFFVQRRYVQGIVVSGVK